MNYIEAKDQLAAIQKSIQALRGKASEIRRSAEPQALREYDFTRSNGDRARWPDLFGASDDLFVIHNMGRSCPYCTLWADGFNGVYEHLASRAAFIVISPDSPPVQTAFASSRGWRFPMISYEGTTFGADSGYHRDGAWWPGVSVLKRRGGDVLRVSDAGFFPGDAFCGVWHLLDMLPEGANGWQPNFSYSSGRNEQ